jgi:hypothetical protein
MSKKQPAVALPANVRTTLSLLVPLTLAMIAVSTQSGGGFNNALPLGVAGVAAWLMGMIWFRYGPAGLGLRGGRPWFAGGGFAVIAWVIFLILRFYLVEVYDQLPTGGAGRQFIYLLVFEAFVVHLWVFGLFFRSVADWRGGLSAAAASGILFAVVAYYTYQENFLGSIPTFLFFIAWGVFYGIVRLRTGSILGLVMVQPMQSLTAWFLFPVVPNPPVNTLHTFYIAMAVIYLVLIWRLWPKTLEDYRV